MKIGDIDIPDSEVEKLPASVKRVLYCMYEAWGAVTTQTLLRAGGSGVAQRRRELKEFLAPHGLTIAKERIGKRNDREVWCYWMQSSEALPIRPKEIVGEV